MISFTVVGTPRPQGSKRLLSRRTGVMVEQSANLAPWRHDVRQAAIAFASPTPTDGPVSIELVFSFHRPRSHYGTGRNSQRLKPSAPLHHTQTPDADKLARACLDALTGVLFHDDAQVIQLLAQKRWACRHSGIEGVTVTLSHIITL